MRTYIVPALNYRNPQEIARVGFSTRTKLPGGFGGPGSGTRKHRNDGKATAATIKQHHGLSRQFNNFEKSLLTINPMNQLNKKQDGGQNQATTN